ncbi:hypothetical protein BX661DRAFT_181866 [Kickxella alabastrina]|uniref:uncharacterized protein n=1 Tax=Kickxella alabastrina TaxID=61397 RepID=UPI0022210772|nr:uncharacterized protein BX661DRAFT_181866 [Kickxella alabastrina]KAI7828314.1 hypothetical protein BX661DRAFT_181866 [Kickxella alabastrina]
MHHAWNTHLFCNILLILCSKRSTKIGASPLAWIQKVLSIPDDVIIARVGLDTYMFLRYMRSMFIIFTVLALLSVVAIMPVHITGGEGEEGINVLNMSNLPQDSNKVWVHIIFFMVFVVWVMRIIFTELKVYTRLRLWWLTNHAHSSKVGASTVMVSSLPDTLIEREDKLHSMFNIFPGGVRQIIVNRDCSELADIVEKRDKYAVKLESLMTSYAVNCEKAHKKAIKKGSAYVEPKRPMMRESKVPFKGPKLDAVEFLSTEIAKLNEQIAESGNDASKFKPQSSAFVLFRKQIAAHMSAQTVLDYKPFSMNAVSLDVNPDDVIWSNLNMNPYNRRIRGYISSAFTVGLVIAWTFLTFAVTGLVSIKNLEKIFKVKMPTSGLFGIFTGIVPSLALVVLMILLPIFLRFLLRMEGTPRVSEVNLRLLNRFYFFQVWNIYFVTIFSTAIISIGKDAFGDPSKIPELISTQVPKASNPILTYVLLLAFTGAANEIIQVAPLAMRYIMPMLFAKTPRAIAEAEAPAEFDWATSIPTHSLIFLMGLSYSFIAPLVNIFVAVYFGLFYLVYRYQFLYVYNDTNWVTGGLSYPKSVSQMMTGVYISEVYLLLMMVARVNSSANAIIRIVFCGLIILCTVGTHLYIKDAYMPISNFLPVRGAAEIEENPSASDRFPDIGGDRDMFESASDASDGNSAIESDSKGRSRIYALYGSLVPKKLIDYVLTKMPSILHSSSSAGSPNPDTTPSSSDDVAEEEIAGEHTDKPYSSMPMPTAHHYSVSGDVAVSAADRPTSANTNIFATDSIVPLVPNNPDAMPTSPDSQMYLDSGAPDTSQSIHSYSSKTELRQRRVAAEGFSSASAVRRSRYDTPETRLYADANDNALAEAFANPALRAKPIVSLWVPVDSNGLCNDLYSQVRHLGAGTIRVVTNDTFICEKGRVRANVEFIPEDFVFTSETEKPASVTPQQ